MHSEESRWNLLERGNQPDPNGSVIGWPPNCFQDAVGGEKWKLPIHGKQVKRRQQLAARNYG